MNVSKLIYAVAAVGFSASMAHATTTLVAVNGTSGPWEQSVNPTLNYGVHDNLAPTSVSSGYDFAPGGVFTFTYGSGTTTNGLGGASYDAEGQTSYVANDGGGTSGDGFPSAHVPTSEYPAYLSELIGAFANSSGVVVGNPFVIGDGPTSETVGSGATQLLLGVNDDIFYDNSGTLEISVAGPTAAISAVPEPGIWVLMFGGIAMIGGMLRIAKARRREEEMAAIATV
jgi:hypothetical protein